MQKMTEKEAKERITKEICSSALCHDQCLYGEGRCAYAIAIRALEKQIAMKADVQINDKDIRVGHVVF